MSTLSSCEASFIEGVAPPAESIERLPMEVLSHHLLRRLKGSSVTCGHMSVCRALHTGPHMQLLCTSELRGGREAIHHCRMIGEALTYHAEETTSDQRWAAWIAKGAEHDTKMTARIVVIAVAVTLIAVAVLLVG